MPAPGGWRRCPNGALGGSWRRTQPFVARWVMRRRVALREDDYLLTACLAAEGSLRGWSAAELLGRESCAGPVLLWLSRGKPQFPYLHTGNDPVGLRAYVYQTKCMVPASQADNSKVLLPSVSYFLFFNKPTPVRFAGGSTFMVQWLLLLSATPSDSNAGAGWRSLPLIHPVL